MDLIISEDNLYHFTPELQYIKSMLSDGFIPFFGTEITDLDDYGISPLRIESFPRVCFTDLPLSHVQNHKSSYGQFGIGMKKEWAISRGLNPLLYLQKNSFVASSFAMTNETLDQLNELLNKNNTKTLEIVLCISRLAKMNQMLGRYTKPFEVKENSRPIQINDKTFKRECKRFYDEREWRYIPHKYNSIDLLELKLFPAYNYSRDELLDVSR